MEFHEVFPDNVLKHPTEDYILDRTMLRPRDAIVFVNECLEVAQGKAGVSPKDIRKAESSYSKKRFNALVDERILLYPDLAKYTDFLNNRKHRFAYREIDSDTIETLILKLDEEGNPKDKIVNLARTEIAYGDARVSAFSDALISTLYKLGVIGIKSSATSTVSWSHSDRALLSPGDLSGSSMIYIAPVFYRYFGINPPN